MEIWDLQSRFSGLTGGSCETLEDLDLLPLEDHLHRNYCSSRDILGLEVPSMEMWDDTCGPNDGFGFCGGLHGFNPPEKWNDKDDSSSSGIQCDDGENHEGAAPLVLTPGVTHVKSVDDYGPDTSRREDAPARAPPEAAIKQRRYRKRTKHGRYATADGIEYEPSVLAEVELRREESFFRRQPASSRSLTRLVRDDNDRGSTNNLLVCGRPETSTGPGDGVNCSGGGGGGGGGGGVTAAATAAPAAGPRRTGSGRFSATTSIFSVGGGTVTIAGNGGNTTGGGNSRVERGRLSRMSRRRISAQAAPETMSSSHETLFPYPSNSEIRTRSQSYDELIRPGPETPRALSSSSGSAGNGFPGDREGGLAGRNSNTKGSKRRKASFGGASLSKLFLGSKEKSKSTDSVNAYVPDDPNDLTGMTNVKVIAIKDYMAAASHELSFKEGQKLKMKHPAMDGQYGFGWKRHSRLAPKKYGYFPLSHVKLYEKHGD